MIAIYLPTTWVVCLGRRIETQGEVGGSLSRWAGMISLGRVWDARSPVVRPFSSKSPLIFWQRETALQNSVLWKFGGRRGGGGLDAAAGLLAQH